MLKVWKFLMCLCLLHTGGICAEPLVIKGKTFDVRVAKTPQEQAKGFMHRTNIAPNEGILFYFQQLQPLAFWMKDTPTSLDLLFIDEKGVIFQIEEGLEPYSRKHIFSQRSAKAALELRHGQVEAHHIRVGDRVLISGLF